MKNILALICSLTMLSGIAQTKDSIATSKTESKLTYKPLIVPALLVGGGFALLNTAVNDNLQPKLRNILGSDFHTKADSFLQYEGILQIYGGRYLGFTPKNDLLHQTINIVVANAIMGTAVVVMKHAFKVERPDMSDQYSFPSGHTGTAFTNASLLFYEYKDSNIWYASSGFLFASATGFLRIANNKHRTSDVLEGAGIGMAVGTLVSYWSPFKSFTFAKNKAHALVYPQMGNSYGIGLLIQN